jgi:transposase InsO family protein
MEPTAYYLQCQIAKWLPDLPVKDRDTLNNWRILRSATDFTTGEIVNNELSGLPVPVIQKYSLLVRWLLLVSDGYNKHKAELKLLGIDSVEQFVNACKAVAGEILDYNHSRLRDKISKYKQNGVAALVSKKWGNTCAQKVNDEVLQHLIDYYGDSRKPQIPMVTKWINETAAAAGWKGFPVVESTVKNHLNIPAVKQVWYMSRHGIKEWQAKFEHKMLRFAPTLPNVLWVGDDTKVNLFYEDKGRKAKLYVYAIIDASTKCWLGWSFADQITQENVREAYRMAIDRAGGIQPLQMQYDNDTANLFFKQLQTLHFPTMPYNGQSKIIERYFGRLQRELMRHDTAFTGQNITSKDLQSRVNPDAAHMYPSREAAIQAQIKYFLYFNNTPAIAGDDTTTPNAKQATASSTEATNKISAQDYMLLFGTWAQKANTYDGNGIRVTTNGVARRFTVNDEYGFPSTDFLSTHCGRRFKVLMHPNGKCIALYTVADQRFIAIAHEKEAMPMAVADYNDGTRSRIDRHLQIKKDQLQATKQRKLNAEVVANGGETIASGRLFVSKAITNAAEAQLYQDQITETNTKPLDLEAERRLRARR